MTPLSRFWSWPLVRLEQLIRLASLVCALVVIGATLSHALQLRDAIQAAAESRLQTVARVLAKEVNRSLLQTRGLLDQVDDALRTEGPTRSPALDALLESMPRQQTLLREIAVVDRRGIVIASSERRHVGLDLSGHDFAKLARDARLHIGQPKAGRTFRTASGEEGPEHAFDGFLTVSRTTAEHPEQPLVVAVIGADSLIGDLKFLSSDDANLITVYRYDGRLLAASEREALRRTTAHPIFTEFLPDRENGGYADRPGDARIWRGHFDTTADFPVVVEVRTPQAAITERWERELVAPFVILLVTLVAVALYTSMTAGALRQRARSEEQAATQERRLRNILDTAADGIVTIDGRGIVREYNRAAETIFGVPAAEALGKPMATLLPHEHADAHQDRVEHYLTAGGGSVVGRGRTIVTERRDGSPMELQLAVSEVIDQGEHLFTGIVRDVTEFRQAEQRFRTLFQRSGEPHLLFVSGELVDCNDAAAMLLNAERREQLLGSRLEQLAPALQAGGPSHEVVATAFAEARRDGIKRLVWAARRLDGGEFPVEMTLTPIRLGTEDAMLVAWHDIAERQRYEQQLRRARDAAESAASAKSQFLAMMSHELRTPMTGIIGMVDLLHDSRMTDEQRHFVDVLRSSAHSLLTVLNDVLDYSKIEAGRLEMERIDFRPAAVAQDVVALLANAASQRGNNLVLRWRDGAVPALRGDPTRLRQVLFNLVGNAIKFTERGSVTVEGDARVQADGRVALAFDVRDTGVGIAPDVLPTLFRPFQQADSSTTRRFGGTGLGLAICRHLVEAMGGEISVDSRPGVGSTFRFVVRLEPAGTLPIESPPTREPDASAVPRGAGLRLLVAEDNPTNRLLVGTRLRRAGHRVDLVENGLKAVEAVRANDYDVVLMDMQMPELDGVGATRAIRALPGPSGRVPIVALTADALPEFRERYMSSGLDDYMTKPIDWPALERVLRRYAPAPTGVARNADAPDGQVAAADTTAAAAVPIVPTVPTVPTVPVGPASTATPAARPDAGPVASMQEDLGEDIWGAVLEIYWPKAAEDLRACRAAMRAADAAALRASAHSLKGASSSLGFESVAACAGALELGGPDAGPAAIEALEAAYEAVREGWSSGVAIAPQD
ncbi:MAG: PAS domain S-box protein [Burkholderiales bacterium]|nr:MAG: PAS domain S-box protein [Burkholderiales bacterium]